MSEYRRTTSVDEIKGFLYNISSTSAPITIWQTTINSQRLVVNTKFEINNPSQREIRVVPFGNKIDMALFDSTKPLNFFSKAHGTVGKVDIIYAGSRHLFVNAPAKMYVSEKRTTPRALFPEQDTPVLLVKQNQNYEFPLIDLSNDGMAFMIPHGPAKIFRYAQDEVKISSLAYMEVEKPFEGNIVYMKKLMLSDNYRVGIKFQHKIDLPTHMELS